MKYRNYPSIVAIQNLDKDQGRSQKLKEVPQNFTEAFKIGNVTANQQRHTEKPTLQRKKNKLEFHSNH